MHSARMAKICVRMDFVPMCALRHSVKTFSSDFCTASKMCVYSLTQSSIYCYRVDENSFIMLLVAFVSRISFVSRVITDWIETFSVLAREIPLSFYISVRTRWCQWMRLSCQHRGSVIHSLARWLIHCWNVLCPYVWMSNEYNVLNLSVTLWPIGVDCCAAAMLMCECIGWTQRTPMKKRRYFV